MYEIAVDSTHKVAQELKVAGRTTCCMRHPPHLDVKPRPAQCLTRYNYSIEDTPEFMITVLSVLQIVAVSDN
jgi:hypothetical protein